jgi:hypothetical protein
MGCKKKFAEERSCSVFEDDEKVNFTGQWESIADSEATIGAKSCIYNGFALFHDLIRY